jgi:alpha-tubulin suppressor-like RCC1 family protein
MKRRHFWMWTGVLALLLLWPALAAAKDKAPKFAAGLNHTLTIRADGTLWACGYNIYGQLGVEDNTDRLTPVRVGTTSDWVAVAAGADHSLGRRAGSSLWAWGHNNHGQLGLGHVTSRTIPTLVRKSSPLPGTLVPLLLD